MKIKSILIFILTCIFIASIAIIASADVWVEPYRRKDGTPVRGHRRSNPDGNPYNNWSFPGNVNPHTGKIAKGNPFTYLKNYYDWESIYQYQSPFQINNEECNNWFEDALPLLKLLITTDQNEKTLEQEIQQTISLLRKIGYLAPIEPIQKQNS